MPRLPAATVHSSVERWKLDGTQSIGSEERLAGDVSSPPETPAGSKVHASSSSLKAQGGDLLEELKDVTVTEVNLALEMRTESCKSLPFTLILYLVFIVTQFAHRDPEFSLQSTMKDIVTDSIVSDAVACEGQQQRQLLSAAASAALVQSRGQVAPQGKTVDTVRTVNDLLLWLEVTLVRWIWAEGADGRGVKMSFNTVVGGIRIKQKRRASSACPGSKNLNGTHRIQCFSGSGGDSTAPLGQLGQGGVPGYVAQEDGFYRYWLDISGDECLALRHLVTMQNFKWLSPGTELVLAQVVFYNAQIAAFVVLEMTFKFALDGSITPKAAAKVLHTDVWKSKLLMFGDFCFVLILLCLTISEAVTSIRAIKSGRVKAYLSWHLLNWMIIGIGCGFSCFFAYMYYALRDVAADVAAVPGPEVALQADGEYLPGEVNPTWESRHSQLDVCYDNVLRLADYLRSWELMTFFYSLVLMMKFFQVFETQPKLGDITETLRRAFVDVAWFMVVFILVFFNFTLGAYFLYGNQLYDWSNLSLAMNSAFRVLMGDFDFGSMYGIAPISAMVWFWLYMGGFYLVMLNMLLAIVLDAYGEVKEESSKKSGTLLEVSKYAFQKARETLGSASQGTGSSAFGIYRAMSRAMTSTIDLPGSVTMDEDAVDKSPPTPQSRDSTGDNSEARKRKSEYDGEQTLNMLKEIHDYAQKLAGDKQVSSNGHRQLHIENQTHANGRPVVPMQPQELLKLYMEQHGKSLT